jgi:hypothetical protein
MSSGDVVIDGQCKVDETKRLWHGLPFPFAFKQEFSDFIFPFVHSGERNSEIRIHIFELRKMKSVGVILPVAATVSLMDSLVEYEL